MRRKSILIGSNGYIGRHLAWNLKNDGFDNSNFDIQNEAPAGVSPYQKLDLTNPGDFSRLDPDVEFIFLFAGLTGTENGFEKYKDFINVNETGLLNLLTWMRRTACKARIVFPSTRLVYKGKRGVDLREDAPKETKTIYAANKLNAENILWMYQNAFGIDYTVFRICVPYGNLFDENFSYGTLGFFMSKARKGEDISLFGNGAIRRTFSHVSDISSIILEVVKLEKTKNEIYNIGGENLSLLEAAKLVAKKYGVQVKFANWPDLALKLESDDTVFDDTKLLSVSEFQYQHSLESWLFENK